MLWALRTYIMFAALIVGLCAMAAVLPRWLNRVQVPANDGLRDISGLEPGQGYWLAPPPYQVGDLLAFRFGVGADDIGFGYVAGLPGDEIRLASGGKLVVGGREYQGWKRAGAFFEIDNAGPAVIPAGHFYLVSDTHDNDSTRHGVVGPDALLGKVKL